MPRNLLICFDGTWNTPDNDGDIEGNTNTNVRLFYNACSSASVAGDTQLKWYDKGVGTKWYDRLAGGIFGVGLSRNIIEGYSWLSDNYQDDDNIYIIGFSRGAYTARSLVGFIRNCGLVKKSAGTRNQRDQIIQEGYQLYRAKDDGADTPQAILFRSKFSHSIKIRFLGIWDTVGALGIPLSSFEWFNRRYYEFHDTELSSIVEYAYQALALDEHRENYAATMWEPRQKPNQTLEQKWFVGAHSNVGGGYKTHTLSDIPLTWLMTKAEQVGLGFNDSAIPNITRRNAQGKYIDSYEKFLKGLYRITRDRFYRPVGVTEHGMEQVDESVLDRCKANPNYRPKNPVGLHAQGPHGRLEGRIRV